CSGERHLRRGRVMLPVCGVMIAGIAASAPLHAQDTLSARELLLRRDVRIAAPNSRADWLRGRLTAIDTGGLSIRTTASEEFAIRRRQIGAIEVSTGLTRSQAGALGFVLGGVAGFAALKVWADATYENDEWNNLAALVLGAPVGGLVGAVFGAKRTRPHWRAVRIREWTELPDPP
ncbi:MAG TPA: hypothetical protein VFQ38_11635, partial [Longimicrobiales bacterium]|nr:hypothetical protein [Longimicrobiales bacterium]